MRLHHLHGRRRIADRLGFVGCPRYPGTGIPPGERPQMATREHTDAQGRARGSRWTKCTRIRHESSSSLRAKTGSAAPRSTRYARLMTDRHEPHEMCGKPRCRRYGAPPTGCSTQGARPPSPELGRPLHGIGPQSPLRALAPSREARHDDSHESRARKASCRGAGLRTWLRWGCHGRGCRGGRNRAHGPHRSTRNFSRRPANGSRILDPTRNLTGSARRSIGGTRPARRPFGRILGVPARYFRPPCGRRNDAFGRFSAHPRTHRV